MTQRMRTVARRAALALACVTAALTAVPTLALAQLPTVTRTTVVSTTIGGVFGYTPAIPALTQNAQTGVLCSPGACYTGSVMVRGNRGWKLQVRLASNPSTFSVYFVQTTVPATVQAVNSGVATLLNTGTWLTVAQSTTPASAATISLMFNARKASGNKGVQPTGAQLAPVIAYQVVANP